jgi:hypothetical protein
MSRIVLTLLPVKLTVSTSLSDDTIVLCENAGPDNSFSAPDNALDAVFMSLMY